MAFKGIEDNSFIKTSEHIQRLARSGEEAAIIIDPTLFTKFNIAVVPTYVLVKHQECPVSMGCKPNFDKITGNVTPKYALEKFAEKGELATEAQMLLENSNET